MSLTSSVDVSSGQSFCSNTSAQVRMEFTCVTVAVKTLAWRIDSSVIEDFGLLATAPQSVSHPPFTVYLDTLSLIDSRSAANMTSRLRIVISDLLGVERVECADVAASDYIDLNFRIICKLPQP